MIATLEASHLQACYFDRDDVALPKISKWLKKQSEEERGHAIGFMKYQNTRGGRIVLQNIQVEILFFFIPFLPLS